MLLDKFWQFVIYCAYYLLQDPKNSKAEIRERVLTYQDHIEDIADYYQDLGQHVNADQDPHTVFECIESNIVNPIPKKA